MVGTSSVLPFYAQTAGHTTAAIETTVV